jgi:glycine/D-amino acid oxidase-like deaminating enzyme
VYRFLAEESPIFRGDGAVEQKAVRSGDSYWRDTGPAPLRCPPLQETTRCESLIIGGGVTGALIADALSRAGLDVIVVDQGAIGLGSTAASTGLLQYEVDSPLVELIRKVGEADAVLAYRRGLQAIDELEALSSELGLQDNFARRSTLCLASSLTDVPELFREFECRRDFGFAVQWLTPQLLKEICGIEAPAALRSEGDAEVDPYRLTQELIRHAQDQGARTFGETKITNLYEGPKEVVATTPQGEIVAKSVIVATGYFAHAFLHDSRVTLKTTYATVGTSPVPENIWPDRSLIWETARPYFYARQTPDGHAMIGGEDTAHANDHVNEDLLAHKTALLTQRFQRLFPGSEFQPAHRWAGTFAETNDGLPFIGLPKGRERIFAALGYGGNGITFSMIAARLLADLVVGRSNAEEAVFSFER